MDFEVSSGLTVQNNRRYLRLTLKMDKDKGSKTMPPIAGWGEKMVDFNVQPETDQDKKRGERRIRFYPDTVSGMKLSTQPKASGNKYYWTVRFSLKAGLPWLPKMPRRTNLTKVFLNSQTCTLEVVFKKTIHPQIESIEKEATKYNGGHTSDIFTDIVAAETLLNETIENFAKLHNNLILVARQEEINGPIKIWFTPVRERTIEDAPIT